MNKISWFKRLFMSWDSIVNHIKSEDSNLEKEIAILQTKNEGFEERKVSLEAHISDLRKTLETLNIELDKLREQNKEYEIKESHFEQKMKEKQDEIVGLNSKLTEVTSTLAILKQNHNDIKREINDKLTPLDKIERTFFANSGPKGKGMLGEKQLENILDRSGLSADAWCKNLPVGSNVVEFAIKTEGTKWIPVDSKVLDTEIDENGNIVIDDKYKAKVKTQATEVSKYLNKTNTAGYGLLVLQSDEIYMKFAEMYSPFMQETIYEKKIYIMSPSSFVQFATSISQILKIYEKVQNDEKIYDNIQSLLESTRKFGEGVLKAQKALNVAVNSHYKLVGNKYNSLAKKVNRDDKQKLLPINEGEEE